MIDPTLIPVPESAEQLSQLLGVLVQAGMVSTVMPLLVAMVVRAGWPRAAKEATVVATSLLAAFLGLYATGQDMRDLVFVVPTMILATRASYQRYWKGTEIAAWLEKVTDISKPQPEARAAEDDFVGV